LRVQSNGRVGIGTLLPTNLLHVYSTAVADGLAIDGTSAPAIVFMNTGAAKAYIGLATQTDNYFHGAISGDLAIRSQTGSIHIGKGNAGNPSATITVAGANV